jgi:hypothetical protein
MLLRATLAGLVLACLSLSAQAQTIRVAIGTQDTTMLIANRSIGHTSTQTVQPFSAMHLSSSTVTGALERKNISWG